MISQDWSFYYNLLHEYFSDLEKEGYITKGEKDDCIDLVYYSSLAELIEECARLGLASIPFAIPEEYLE